MRLKTITDKNERYVASLYQHDSTLLFQRLNFFLISTSFLISAFVLIVINPGFGTVPRLLELSYIVVLVGFVLSSLFSIINYMNSRILGLYKDLALSQTKYSNHYAAIQSVFDKLGGFWGLILGIIKDMINIFIHPINMRTPGFHTWLIPILFSIFWLIMALEFLPDHPIKHKFILGFGIFTGILILFQGLKWILDNIPPNIGKPVKK